VSGPTPALLPTMFNDRFYVERGGLGSYGVNIYESGRQAARLLDKVIRGVQPGDIPIEPIRAIGAPSRRKMLLLHSLLC
jgi:ABC-type uncharacterized transport system substrate-binding protein